ncbi:MAG: hypothetical protein Unbinned4234contig1003_8 [Prokaryotic dsDNA virus sp.]|nr:MAG: hypothetical protein Unbinned4234contig1003_8 [Prokaryotic dsDNA virus sp.]|tara:strand:+ start:151 stop:687 length:537 start_codon:yes stop_codon:yes gene_type:complete
MSEEMKQDNAQENPSNAVENKPDSPSSDGLLPEIMAKKEKIKTLEAELAKRDANDEKRRVKKLEEEGKYKELLAEQSSTIDNLNAKLESQTGIVNSYKQNLVNGLASDDERKEYLSTKSVDFLEELTKEKAAMAPPPVDNPQESLGSVRKVVSNKPYATMTEAERREWHESQTAHLRK